MRRGLHETAGRPLTRTAALLAALALGGCVQMTRHSNMMIFGTNTVVGIRAGVNATSVPEVAIGYARQEAVVLPLVANTAETEPGTDHLDRLKPCDLTQTPVKPISAPDFTVHPCSLVGINHRGGILDSYSVLASFGGTFEADATGSTTPNTTAKAGVAQYFATGVAAQVLAARAGAAAVAAGGTADNANADAASTQAVLALFGNPSTGSSPPPEATAPSAYDTFVSRITAAINSVQDDKTVYAKLKDFQSKAGIGAGLDPSCTDKATCIGKINKRFYKYSYDAHPDKLDAALTAEPW